MCRGRSALVIVILCFVCLLALKPQPTARLCTQDIVNRVEYLIGEAQHLVWLDSKLYTPTIEDFQNCPSSTFRCFADEIKVLIEEWEKWVYLRRLRRLNKKLEKLAASFNQTETLCRQCELLREQTAGTFLNILNTVLKMMNSRCRIPPIPHQTHTETN